MQIQVLKSKIHMAKITSTELNYEGSIAVCPGLLEAAGLIAGEKVSVLNFDNANCFETYVIKGQPGEIGLRGPASKLGKVGQKVIILSYALLDAKEAQKFKPKLVYADEKNGIKRTK